MEKKKMTHLQKIEKWKKGKNLEKFEIVRKP